ncbi:MAG: hypothetical protein RIF41_01915 [Polyangiaceae bacterium]
MMKPSRAQALLVPLLACSGCGGDDLAIVEYLGDPPLLAAPAEVMMDEVFTVSITTYAGVEE